MKNPPSFKSTNKKTEMISRASEADQVTVTDFKSFIDRFFIEVDEECLKVLKKNNKIKETNNKEVDDLLRMNIAACLIDDDDFVYKKYKVQTNSLKEELLEEYKDKGLLEKYNSQVEINNRRKKIILQKIKERLKPQAYFHVLRMIDKELEMQLSKRKRGKKRKMLDVDEEYVLRQIEKRKEFKSLFSSINREEYLCYEDLFEDENVNVEGGEFEYLS